MNAVVTRQGYTLTEDDAATGQRHTWWRKLETQAGRWTSPDPYIGSMRIVNPGSLNRLGYVEGDPVNKVDPTGLDFTFIGPIPKWLFERPPASPGGGGGGRITLNYRQSNARTDDAGGGGGAGMPLRSSEASGLIQEGKRSRFVKSCIARRIKDRVQSVNSSYGTGIGRNMRDGCVFSGVSGAVAGTVFGAGVGAVPAGIIGCAGGALGAGLWGITVGEWDRRRDLEEAQQVSENDTKQCNQLADEAGLKD